MELKTVNKINFIRNIILFAFALVFGIAFLIGAILLTNQTIPENFVETQAKIIRIEEELRPGYDESDGIGVDDYDHRVFVSYTFEGKTYDECEYGNYDSAMKEGDTVVLFVDPASPEEFISDPSGSGLFVVIGAVIILIGIGGIAFNINKKKKASVA